MEKVRCPKCGGEMHRGVVNGAITELRFYPVDQLGKLLPKRVVIDLAAACLVCGFVELNLDPDVLSKLIKDHEEKS